MMERNPLIGGSSLETAQRVDEALGALMDLMAPQHSGLCRLMEPIVHAIEYLAQDNEQ